MQLSVVLVLMQLCLLSQFEILCSNRSNITLSEFLELYVLRNCVKNKQVSNRLIFISFLNSTWFIMDRTGSQSKARNISS